MSNWNDPKELADYCRSNHGEWDLAEEIEKLAEERDKWKDAHGELLGALKICGDMADKQGENNIRLRNDRDKYKELAEHLISRIHELQGHRHYLILELEHATGVTFDIECWHEMMNATEPLKVKVKDTEWKEEDETE